MRVKWPRLCAGLSWETWALVFTTYLMLDKLLSLSAPAFSSPFCLSQCRESNGYESILSIKCYLNMVIIVSIEKIRYQKTRQADRDFMLQTRCLKLEIYRLKMCFVWTTIFFGFVLVLFGFFKSQSENKVE